MTTPTNAKLADLLEQLAAIDEDVGRERTAKRLSLAAKRLRAADNFAQVAIETVSSARVLIGKSEEDANHWRNFYAARFQDALDQYRRGDDQ